MNTTQPYMVEIAIRYIAVFHNERVCFNWHLLIVDVIK